MIQLPDIGQIILTAGINALSGLVANVFYIMLIIWSVKTLVKQVPLWLDKWDKIKIRERTISQAKGRMGKE